MPNQAAEATGLISDLFAASVGFSAGWGFSRCLTGVSRKFETSAGHLDWKTINGVVASTISDTIGLPAAAGETLPDGVTDFASELYAHVAVGQSCSGWGKLPEGRLGMRLLAVRCHVGKFLLGDRPENIIVLQYRVWTREGGGEDREITDAAEAKPLFEDVHLEIAKRLIGRKGRR